MCWADPLDTLHPSPLVVPPGPAEAPATGELLNECNHRWQSTFTGSPTCIHCGVKAIDIEAKVDTIKPADPVNHPTHYNSHPSGVECITITEHMGFNLGNAVKYIWRADLKNDAIEDLRKALFYVKRELAKRGADV